jgi:hypothetical protein
VSEYAPEGRGLVGDTGQGSTSYGAGRAFLVLPTRAHPVGAPCPVTEQRGALGGGVILEKRLKVRRDRGC